MNLTASVVRNTASQIASRIIVILLSLLTTAILTRYLGAKGFGDYVFLTSFALLFVGLTDFGTTTVAVREASLERQDREKIFAGVLGLRLFICLPVFLIFNLLIIVLPQFDGLRQASFIASLVLFFLVLRTTSQAVLQTFLRLDLSSGLEIAASVFLVFLLAGFLFFKASLSLSALMAFWVISAFVSCLFSLLFWKRYLPVRISFNPKFIKQIFGQSYPLGFYLLAYAVYDRGIDSFFLKTFYGSDAVGFYGLAYKIHGNLIFGAAFLMNSLFPVFSSLKNSREQLENLYRKSFTVLLAAGATALLSGLILAPLAVRLIAGSDYLNSGNILRILLFATLFSFLNHLTGYLMIALGEQKKLFSFSVISLSINLILNFFLIQKYSFWAAAAVTVLTEAAIFFQSKFFLQKKYSLKFTFADFQKCFFLLLKKRIDFFEEK